MRGADQSSGNKASTATSKPGGSSLTAPSEMHPRLDRVVLAPLVVNGDATLGIEDQIVLEACKREIAAELSSVIDRGGGGRQDFDNDDQIDEKDRIAGQLWTANDRAIRSVDRPLVDQDAAAAAKDLAIATGAARGEL